MRQILALVPREGHLRSLEAEARNATGATGAGGILRCMQILRRLSGCSIALLAVAGVGCAARPVRDGPFTVVLGIAQDGGVPQAGSFADPRWDDAREQRSVVSLGVVDPDSGRRWMIDATPDFRTQLLTLHRISGGAPRPVADGVLLTHAHMGHYTGLMFVGKESIGAKDLPVYAMPRMQEFLEQNGPWSQLVSQSNIVIRPLAADQPVQLAPGLTVTPILVPHRQEFSETVAFRIAGRTHSVLWMPDIDSWRELDAMGTRIEDLIASVDIAYLDGTFFANGEIPGRDMSGFPHPFISDSIARLGALPERERHKVRFIHLNHTNPALRKGTHARRAIEAAGMDVAEEGEIRWLDPCQ